MDDPHRAVPPCPMIDTSRDATVRIADKAEHGPNRNALLSSANRKALARDGYVRMRDVPLEADHRTLLAIARALGRVSMRALSRNPVLAEPGGVQRVMALPVPPLDQYGQTLRSASAGAFDLHTDEAFAARPCRYVLLHCWCSDPAGGGLTLVTSRAAIAAAADPHTLQQLRTLALPYPDGPATTLSRSRLRYNRAEIEGCAQRRGVPLDTERRAWLDRFDHLFAACARRIALERGDLLILDNHRMLHGRTAFAAGSPRLLKRVRVDADGGFDAVRAWIERWRAARRSES